MHELFLPEWMSPELDGVVANGGMLDGHHIVTQNMLHIVTYSALVVPWRWHNALVQSIHFQSFKLFGSSRCQDLSFMSPHVLKRVKEYSSDIILLTQNHLVVIL